MILLLGGTADARELLALLRQAGFEVLVSVTSKYAAELVSQCQATEVWAKPLDRESFLQLITSRGIKAVIDATHPYALEISRLAQEVCRSTGTVYLRFERAATPFPDHPLIHYGHNWDEVAVTAADLGDVIFLTTGSKELESFLSHSKVAGKRVIARVLPEPERIAKCLKLGLAVKDIVALQGPCSVALNKALFLHYCAEVIVTKDSGRVGGADTKLAAALELGLPVVVLKRPQISYDRQTSCFDEIISILQRGVDGK